MNSFLFIRLLLDGCSSEYMARVAGRQDGTNARRRRRRARQTDISSISTAVQHNDLFRLQLWPAVPRQ